MTGDKTIFIAEDDQHFCELYQMALGADGYEVRCAYNGRDALERILQEAPDLIILDVMMPGVDGYEVCRRLRELPHFSLTPIIMLTALSTDDEKIKGYNVGADDYITKPFPLRVLKAKVRSILDRVPSRKTEQLKAAVEQPKPVVEQPKPAVEQPKPVVEQPKPAVERPVPVVEQPKPAVEQPKPAVIKEVTQPTIVREVIREQPTVIPAAAAAAKPIGPVRTIGLGEDLFECLFGGAAPQGSNILVIGPLGSGKSFFSRLFLAQGTEKGEKCMFICLDDDPSLVRKQLSKHNLDVSSHEAQNRMCFVDAYSWSGRRTTSAERFAIKGALDLSDLSTLITEAGAALAQTDQLKGGGRRVIDSISSLFLNFDLAYVQRFIGFMARSGHFADVSTIFVVEEGACDDQSLNNITYIMDGILEFRREGNRFLGRAQTLKWAAARPEWTDFTQTGSH